ncbi:hypothetical protein [Porphyrobacter sp. AAP60]|uniref:hypothetical protein n=1 Tax=Porphyrobacter sp. AAP60 TaxID=1523423 RepID=UPI000A8458AC|nr:hypothetical protein [Porphyrobacter sp. AAP60]
MKSVFLPAMLAAIAATPVPALADGGTARSMVKPARLIEFTGERELLKESARLRVWRGEIGYTLEVDAAGTPTECELVDRFRMNYVNVKLCDVLMKHHSFEPALDATGSAVDGSYEGRLNFMEMREKE